MQTWPESLEEGLAESSDLTLWSVQRPLKDLKQINDISETPFGDEWHGSRGEMGKEGREQRAVRKYTKQAEPEALGQKQPVQKEAGYPLPNSGLCLPCTV